MAMETIGLVVTPITEVGNWLFGALKRRICYIANYSENLRKLQSQASDLKTKTNDLQNLVEEARRRFEEPEQAVIEWLKTADNIQVVVDSINDEAMQNKRCVKGLCPDLGSRLRLSKEAVSKSNDIKELQERERRFTRISHVPPPPSMEPEPKDWVEGFASRDLTMNKVMAALHDESISSIGVYGMGGIGKTTLLKSLNNKLLEGKLFNKVIIVTVSQDPVKDIQDKIAIRLGIKLDPLDSEVTRANRLSDCFKKEGPVLLIFDDLWKKLDVAKMGILDADQHTGSKFIIATRVYDVCIQMKIVTRVKMDLLPESEAWILFEDKAGQVVKLPNVKQIAVEIVKKCKGSPLAITTLGASLREGGEFKWRDALRVLENPSAVDLEEIMPEVIASLRFSYDNLEGDRIKLCFLFCCMFPEDHNIELSELRNYGIGEGFLNVNGSLEDVSNKLLVYVEILKNCGLLLSGDEEGQIKMHDVVRDVAIWIASENKNGFAVNVGRLKLSMMNTLEGYKRVSFINNASIELSIPSECPQLQSLLIRDNNVISICPENFLEKMQSLVILELCSSLSWSYGYLPVPKSLACLTKLRILSLVRCDVSEIVSVLGGLMNLEILSLRESNIGRLPEQMGNLKNLKCLDLTSAVISAIAPNVLSRLCNLQELYMKRCFKNWDLQAKGGEKNASFTEVASLAHLSSLEIEAGGHTPPGMSCSWRLLKHFSLAIGHEYLEPNTSRYQNTLHLGRVYKIVPWVNNFLSLSIHKLRLRDCGLKNLAHLDAEGVLKNLEHFEVYGCNEIEYLIDFDETRHAPEDSLQCLKYLDISHMERMKKLFQGVAPVTFLGQLRILRVDRCPNFISFLSSDKLLAAQNLEKLGELSISNCDGLQVVINTEDQTENCQGAVQTERIQATPATPMLPELRQINLSKLSNMTNIWKGRIPVGSLQNLQSLHVWECHCLKYLISSSLAERLQNLEILEISKCNEMEKLVSSGSEREQEAATSSYRQSQGNTSMNTQNSLVNSTPTTSPTFQNLRLLSISHCKRLEKIFSFNMALELQQLQQLTVYACDRLEEIIQRKDGEEVTMAHDYPDLLPKLHFLELNILPSLTSFYQGNLLLNCHLKRIKVHECPKLNTLPLTPQSISTIEELEGNMVWRLELFQSLPHEK